MGPVSGSCKSRNHRNGGHLCTGARRLSAGPHVQFPQSAFLADHRPTADLPVFRVHGSKTDDFGRVDRVVIVAFGIFAGDRAATISISLIGAAKAVEYISDILYVLAAAAGEHVGDRSLYELARPMLSVGALSLGVSLTHSLGWGAACMLVSSSVVLFAYDIPKTLSVERTHFRTAISQCSLYFEKVMAERGQGRRLWKLAMSGLPMGFVLMLVSLNLNISRLFRFKHHPEELSNWPSSPPSLLCWRRVVP